LERWYNEPQKKPLHCGGNLDHVRVMVRWGPRETHSTQHGWICVTWHLFNSNFATLAALVEVCSLPSAVIVFNVMILASGVPRIVQWKGFRGAKCLDEGR